MVNQDLHEEAEIRISTAACQERPPIILSTTIIENPEVIMNLDMAMIVVEGTDLEDHEDVLMDMEDEVVAGETYIYIGMFWVG